MASQVESIKWVPGTRFIVDGFRFQSPLCAAYFLTHYHSDHTTGLTRAFDAGLIYCSPITYRLLTQDMGLRPHVLRQLELDQTVVIDGVEVTPLCANHCPGAVMLLFRVPQPSGPPRTVLHTGDLRWDAALHGRHPALLAARVDTLQLDTTYCQPKWTFPPQAEAVAGMAALMRREAAAEPATLFACASYRIGKERAYFGAALALGWKVWASPAKRRLLRLLGLPREWLALLEDDPDRARLHVVGMGEQALAERIKGTRYTRVVLLRPTGWSYRKSGKPDVRVEGCVTTVGVPYSEHSSFTELQDCVRTLRPRRLVPTVNAEDAATSRALVDRLCGLMDLSQDRSRLDCYLRGGPGEARPAAVGQDTPRAEIGREPGEAERAAAGPSGVVQWDFAGGVEGSATSADRGAQSGLPLGKWQRGMGGDASAAEASMAAASTTTTERGVGCSQVPAPSSATPSSRCGVHPGAARSSGVQSAEPAGGEAAEEGRSVCEVDLTQVDVDEQRRMWDAIGFAARKPSGAARRQGSIKAFLVSPRSGGGVGP